MTEDIIIYDPLGELQKAAKDIEDMKKDDDNER